MAIDERTSGRPPDVSFRCGRMSISAWQEEERGWSFQLSRSYKSADEQTRYEQMRLFASDLPVVVMLLQKAWGETTPAVQNGG